jgi:hypothetical protein
MTDKVFVVTAPDDVRLDGLRLLLINLKPEYTQIISDALAQIESSVNLIVYVAQTDKDINWFLEKKNMSDLMIFDANSEDQFIAGYLGAQPNSFYFGSLKYLSLINNSAIYDTTQVVELLEKSLKRYGKVRK